MADKLVNRLLVALLGKRVRRVAILYRWNMFSNPCERATSIEDVMQVLLTTFLYEPICFELTHEALYPWGCRFPGLSIPFGWLAAPERQWIKSIHAYRRDLFMSERRLPTDNTKFHLSQCKAPAALCLQHRRELVRDFVGLCTMPVPRIGLDADKNCKLQASLRFALTVTIHRLIHEPVNNRVDAFLMPLVRYLSNGCAFEHMMVMDLAGDAATGVIYDPA